VCVFVCISIGVSVLYICNAVINCIILNGFFFVFFVLLGMHLDKIV